MWTHDDEWSFLSTSVEQTFEHSPAFLFLYGKSQCKPRCGGRCLPHMVSLLLVLVHFLQLLALRIPAWRTIHIYAPWDSVSADDCLPKSEKVLSSNSVNLFTIHCMHNCTITLVGGEFFCILTRWVPRVPSRSCIYVTHRTRKSASTAILIFAILPAQLKPTKKIDNGAENDFCPFYQCFPFWWFVVSMESFAIWWEDICEGMVSLAEPCQWF